MSDRGTTPNPDDTLTLEQAADYLHLGLEAMRDLVKTGQVPALSCNQKHTVMLRGDLTAYIREQARAQADQRKRRQTPHAAPAHTRTAPRRRTIKPDLDRYEITTAEGA